MTIAQDLNVYLMEVASKQDGDCCEYMADWCVRRGFDDPMARWRGTYDDHGTALMDEYGLLNMCDLGMIEAGIPEADEPMIGDVGIVECVTHDGRALVGAIYGGKRWSALGEKGLFCASMEPARVWRINDPLRDAVRG